MLAKTICEDCEKVYMGGPKSYFCPDCRRKRLSRQAKERGLNKIGNQARANQRGEADQ